VLLLTQHAVMLLAWSAMDLYLSIRCCKFAVLYHILALIGA
jgi:hypothetical protein